MTVVDFKPKAEQDAALNLAEFIRMSRFDLTVLGAELDWASWSWDGVGQFRKMATPRASALVDQTPYLLDGGFIDFARAYIRHEAGNKPGTRYTHTKRLVSKRLSAIKELALSALLSSSHLVQMPPMVCLVLMKRSVTQSLLL